MLCESAESLPKSLIPFLLFHAFDTIHNECTEYAHALQNVHALISGGENG